MSKECSYKSVLLTRRVLIIAILKYYANDSRRKESRKIEKSKHTGKTKPKDFMDVFGLLPSVL